MNVMLRNPNSSRVIYAAVFIPHDESEEVEYVLPHSIRRPLGFVEYDRDRHHKKSGFGILCCGNCYEEGQIIEVYHRDATPPLIAGGQSAGLHATFSARRNTAQDHSQYCRDKRHAYENASSFDEITFHINIPETYSSKHVFNSANKNHHIHADNRLDDRTPVAVNASLSEILKKAGRYTKHQVQNSFVVTDAVVMTFRQAFIDGDGWQDLLRELIMKGRVNRRAGPFNLPHRIFLVTNPSSKNLREFNLVSGAKPEETKISCRQYQFKDGEGYWHVIQPSIHTKAETVKGLFEMQGDYLVTGRFRYLSNETRDGTVIHQIQIELNSENLAVRLYNNPKTKIRDLETMELLHRNFGSVEPKTIPPRKAKKVQLPSKAAAQPELFPETLFRAPA